MRDGRFAHWIAIVCAALAVTLSAGCSAPKSHAMPSSSGAGGYSTGGDVQAASVESASAAPSPGGGSAKPSKNMPSSPSKRKFVRRAMLTIEVGDEDEFPAKIERAAKLARGMDGYVSGETEESITMMVPTERLDEALDDLSKLGEVTERDIDVQDVTRQYTNLQVRIDNLRKMRNRLKELVEQSVTVEEVLKVERELGRVTSELEQLEARMRVLERDTTYATIRVYFEEKVTPGPVGWIFYGTFLAIKWLFVW